jgi:hypothetical protein
MIAAQFQIDWRGIVDWPGCRWPSQWSSAIGKNLGRKLAKS